jgi:hypothetical protein
LCLQGFIVHPPASFDHLWRCGALAGLVATPFRLRRPDTSDAASNMMTLLAPMLSASGQQPWYAASTERQQFALLALAHVGGRTAAAVLALTADQGGVQLPDAGVAIELAEAVAVLRAAAEQLGRPPLRALVAEAAPALLRDADACSDAAAAASSSSRTRSSPVNPGGVGVELPRAHLELLAALGAQLDPLGLGMRLPGCYNPACTSVTGASEAGTKLCKGCKTAR